MGSRTTATTLGWGVVLACSWTWCIGMYLPVLILDEFGWLGFVPFAAANVLGCVAFGYVVKSGARSRVCVASHGRAMALFSIVTVAFHVFFVAFLLGDSELSIAMADRLSLPRDASWAPAFLGGAVFVLAFLLSFLPLIAWLVLGLLVYTVSIITMVIVGFEAFEVIPLLGARTPPTDLLWLVPVLAFGFVLCPYLDLTFHRAIEQAPSRHAFTVFGVLFAAMLLLTCLIWFGRSSDLVIAHLLAQSVFTMGLHLREMRKLEIARTSFGRGLLLMVPLVGLAARPLAMTAGGDRYDGEDTYLRWFVFYGLVFPAYVLVFMGDRRQLTRTVRSLITFSIIVGAAVPLYELAFLHDRMWLLMIPMVVAALWTVARNSSRASRTASTG